MNRLMPALVIALGLHTGHLLAQPPTTVEIERVETYRTSVSQQAARWGLTEAQWHEYHRVMNDRRGTWSPGLDPITALGVSANTGAERKHYAELFVRTEFERTRKELAFQLAVDDAWARLYPETPRLGSRSTTRVSLERTSRYALIVTPDCEACSALLAERLPDMLGEVIEGVDVHVVGTAGDDNVLREWIANEPALIAALKDGKTTVNHGDQFEDLSRFPAIYSKKGRGQWAREL